MADQIFDPLTQTYRRDFKPVAPPAKTEGSIMGTESGVTRVTNVITSEIPKLNKICDDVAAQAQASVLRAAKVVSDIGADLRALDAAVTQLEDLRNQSTNNPPADQALDAAISDRDAQLNVALAPGSEPGETL